MRNEEHEHGITKRKSTEARQRFADEQELSGARQS